MCYARNMRGKSVGSFSKTNPPVRVFGVVSGEKWSEFATTESSGKGQIPQAQQSVIC
jgi:hypothetical protein